DDPMLEDAGIEVELEKTSLVPGESTVAYADYTVTQEDIDSGLIYNIATATGTPPGYDPENPPTDPTDPGYPPVSPPSEVEVPTKQTPDVTLEKAADKEEVTKIGEKLVYTFTITNTGNVTLYDLVLNDPMLGGEIKLAVSSLAPGESTEVSVDHTVTEEDGKKNSIVNEADVTGTTKTGESVTDEDQELVRVNIEQPGEELPKTATNMFNYLLIGGLATLLGAIVLVYARRREA
ncbi:MAG TPA: LPXTG cell wall anchor domain-containing protein, partial [Tissierellaceae bacterium]|nr:LPXTG cell wall anchor domain-containing protein [Tissierellaceae bacterium]